jgi:hypothetical protein
MSASPGVTRRAGTAVAQRHRGGIDDIGPDQAAMSIGARWRKDPKAVKAALSRPR